MGRASDQIFVFKALTSSIGLLASGLLLQGLSSAIGLFDSDLLLQGFHLREWKPLFGIIFSFKALSSTLGFFASGLLLQGFHLLDRKSDASCNSLRRYTFG